MSHYGGENVKHEGFTQTILSEVIERERRISYFTKVASLFRDPKRHPYSPEDFYPLVAFYNFLPEVYAARQRVDEKQWLNPDTQRFFFRVVDYLKPQRILLTGEQLWRVLPSCIPGPQGKRRVREDGTGLNVQFGGVEAECCWYGVEGAEDCLVGAITHPSTRKFNKNRAVIRAWVQKFMGWTKIR